MFCGCQSHRKWWAACGCGIGLMLILYKVVQPKLVTAFKIRLNKVWVADHHWLQPSFRKENSSVSWRSEVEEASWLFFSWQPNIFCLLFKEETSIYTIIMTHCWKTHWKGLRCLLDNRILHTFYIQWSNRTQYGYCNLRQDVIGEHLVVFYKNQFP